MKRMADRYFRSNENKVNVSEDPLDDNRLTSGENRRSGEEKNMANISEEKENKKDHLTATYWG